MSGCGFSVCMCATFCLGVYVCVWFSAVNDNMDVQCALLRGRPRGCLTWPWAWPWEEPGRAGQWFSSLHSYAAEAPLQGSQGPETEPASSEAVVLSVGPDTTGSDASDLCHSVSASSRAVGLDFSSTFQSLKEADEQEKVCQPVCTGRTHTSGSRQRGREECVGIRGH